jgi:dienelactone hydrolase
MELHHSSEQEAPKKVTKLFLNMPLVQLIIYPGAHHGFDLAGLRFSNGIEYMGHRLEYNDAATRDSIEKVRVFFRQTLSHE